MKKYSDLKEELKEQLETGNNNGAVDFLNESSEEKMFTLIGNKDAEGKSIPSRMVSHQDTLRKIDRKGAIGVDKGLKVLPDMYEFMRVTDGIAYHTGTMISLTPKMVKETNSVFALIPGPSKTYDIKKK